MRAVDVLQVVLEPDDHAAVRDADLPPVELVQLAVELELAPERDAEVHHVVGVAGLVGELAVAVGPRRDRAPPAARLGAGLGDARPVRDPGIGAERDGLASSLRSASRRPRARRFLT